MMQPAKPRPEQHRQTEPADVFLSLGSNMGDRLGFLTEAVRRLASHTAIELDAVSSVYETDPVGCTDQPLFYNIVIRIRTTLDPHSLLKTCQAIENDLGRQRLVRWGPRTIDIDILTYDQLSLQDPDLELPHPRLQERDFVRVPLEEIVSGSVGRAPGVRLIRSGWYCSC